MPPIEIKYLFAPTATLLAIVVSVYLFVLQRRKEISYHVLWCQPLIELKGKMRDRIKIEFDGHPAGDSTFLVVRVSNSGHVPIHPGDYQVKLALDTGVSSNVVMAEVVETEPEGLGDQSMAEPLIESVQHNKVTLRPMLLNRHDSVTIQLLVEDFSGKVTMTGHVQGMRNLRPYRESPLIPTMMIHGGQAVSWTAMFIAGPQMFTPFKFVEVVPLVFLFLTGQVMLFGGLHLTRVFQSAEQWAP